MPHATAPQDYLHGLRGRMDERYDLVRSARNERYVYLRQFMPHRIYGQYINYMFQTPTTRVWKQLYDAEGVVDFRESVEALPEPVYSEFTESKGRRNERGGMEMEA